MNRNAFNILVLAALLGAAAFGFLRAARAVGDRWTVKGKWWGLGIVSLVIAVVVVLTWTRTLSPIPLGQLVGAIIIAVVAVAAFWIPSALRRRSRPSS